MAKIQIELPDEAEKAARDPGLLTPQALDKLLADAIRRRKAAGSLLRIADRVEARGLRAYVDGGGRRGGEGCSC